MNTMKSSPHDGTIIDLFTKGEEWVPASWCPIAKKWSAKVLVGGSNACEVKGDDAYETFMFPTRDIKGWRHPKCVHENR